MWCKELARSILIIFSLSDSRHAAVLMRSCYARSIPSRRCWFIKTSVFKVFNICFMCFNFSSYVEIPPSSPNICCIFKLTFSIDVSNSSRDPNLLSITCDVFLSSVVKDYRAICVILISSTRLRLELVIVDSLFLIMRSYDVQSWHMLSINIGTFDSANSLTTFKWLTITARRAFISSASVSKTDVVMLFIFSWSWTRSHSFFHSSGSIDVSRISFSCTISSSCG